MCVDILAWCLCCILGGKVAGKGSSALHDFLPSGLVSPLPPDSLRTQIVTKLLDHSCKDTQKTQSDGWSSDEEDDDVFDASRQEMTSPQTGVCSPPSELIDSEPILLMFSSYLCPQVHR